MSKTRREGVVEVPEEVAKASAAVRRAVARLVKLLGHGDDPVVGAAAQALEALGEDATVGPLADALPRAGSPRHRLAIVLMLREPGPAHRDRVLMALLAARQRERDIRVAAQIQASLIALSFPGIGPTGSPAAKHHADQGADRTR